MLHKSVKKPLVLVVVGIMLLTFCVAPPPAEAVLFLVPAVVILAVTAVGGAGVAIKNATKSADEKKTARQEKNSTRNQPAELKSTLAEPAHG